MINIYNLSKIISEKIFEIKQNTFQYFLARFTSRSFGQTQNIY